MAQYACEEHGGIFVYEAHRSTKCPLCSDIEGLEEEIRNLKDEVDSLSTEA
jgi:hypothetical protein